jgi:hypothetical protein
VSDTKTFRDPAASTSRKLYALYIMDLNSAVSLIYDSTSSYTNLAKINFLTKSITYQKAFPKIMNIRSAIFTSPTIYYTGSFDA